MKAIPKIFLDSSVLLAGMYSNKGGSAEILRLIRQKKILGFISQSVIEETQRNLKKKFPLKLIKKLEKIIKIIVIQDNFNPKDIIKYRPLVNIKDLHILIFTRSSGAEFLTKFQKKE